MTIKLTGIIIQSILWFKPEHILFHYYSLANKCTHVVTGAGITIEVKETPEEIEALIKAQKDLAASAGETQSVTTDIIK